ncbi:MAG: cupin protein [Solirubrobacterales bacterium]|nr:cupin protein [Solirubrobacterales bacterium]
MLRPRAAYAAPLVSALVSDRRPVSEAKLEQTDAGLVTTSAGWFVLNARDARWIERPGRGHSLPFTGWTEEEAETNFRELGVNLVALGGGEPIGMYHWEADCEDFLVLSGDGILIVEGEERPLRQWDFVHCPPGTRHVIVGAGEDGCVLVAIGTRAHIGQDCNGGAYVVDEAARRHGAAPDDPDDPYARFPAPEATPHRDGWLPFGS